MRHRAIVPSATGHPFRNLGRAITVAATLAAGCFGIENVDPAGTGGVPGAGTGGAAAPGAGGTTTVGTGGTPVAGTGGAPVAGTGGTTIGGTGGATVVGTGGAAGAAGRAGTGGAAGAGGAVAGSGGRAAATGGTTGAGGTSGVGGATDLACAREFTIPTMAQLKTNAKLPDPFTFFDGTKVTSKADWACRRKEISLFAQEFIYGRKPGNPESVTATFSGGTLNVTVANGGRSIQFSVPIRAPSGGGTAPYPAIFSVGATAQAGVATIDYAAVGEMLAKSNGSQGRIAPSGLFYTLYPDYKTTGSLMAWAWGASRIIDALEKTTGHNIDTKRLSALGCSRNGKEAGLIGLFDDRIALVAAMSPGSGLTSGWRIAETEGNVQTAGEIYGEDTWMGDGFRPFSGANTQKLPIDQHLVLALAWPRPIIMMEGTNDSWNCPRCEYMTLKYTQMIYTALGSKDYIGFPQPPHGHCAQTGTFAIDYYNAFVNRFLKGMTSVTTANMFSDNFTFDMAKWQDGPVPAALN